MRNDDVMVLAGTPTELTNAAAAAVRVQASADILLQATTGPAPTSWAGALRLGAGETLAADLTLAQLWPGVAGASRLWAMADQSVSVSVSHADA
ncbi:hypothetical protein ACN9JG_06265 [Cereibacter azotoformans]|uniref:hypothetical protein n=1 Tax=Cereibacter azotoformans TaxID=43057 RepID=UPI003B219A88